MTDNSNNGDMVSVLTKCVFDWFYTQENGEEYSVWEVGKTRGSAVIIRLQELLPYAQGDRHSVEATLSDGTSVRTYNVNQLTFTQQKAPWSKS